MSTYKDLLYTARKILMEKEITDADLDAWYLLSNVFGMSRTDYLLQENKNAAEEDALVYLQLIQRRTEHVPLQYIIGSQEFMGLEFFVTPHVLIPRQDTELLVEEALKISDGKTVLDMCTGSGCIIISIAKLVKLKKAVGVDISDDALELAVRNADHQEVRVEFIRSNLFERVEGYYDVIVSNPPYIPTKVINTLMPEVKEHEPLLALDGREDGLFFYRRITADLKKHLCSKGSILFEIGHDQGEAVSRILEEEGFKDIMIKKDLSGLDRIVSAIRP